MKKETWICDVCDFKTSNAKEIETACIQIGSGEIYWFHVCKTCYSVTIKGVFQKIFNKLKKIIEK